MEIQDGNKLIAEFLGYTYIPFNSPDHKKPFGCTSGYWKKTDYKNYFEYRKSEQYILKPTLYYHESWDKMMKVVEKIETKFSSHVTLWSRKEGATIECSPLVLEGSDFYESAQSKSVSSTDKLEALWTVVVKFLYWYKNENTKLSENT